MNPAVLLTDGVAPWHAQQPSVAPGPSRAKRILVVDDDLDSAIMLSLLLRRLGYIVVTAKSGKEAVQWGAGLLPDVVLLDIGMPGMDGFETCRNIRQHDWGAGTFVVAVTAYGEREYRERSKAAGFDLHLVKPVDPVLIRELLTSAPYQGDPKG